MRSPVPSSWRTRACLSACYSDLQQAEARCSGKLSYFSTVTPTLASAEAALQPGLGRAAATASPGSHAGRRHMDRRVVATAAGAVAVIVSLQVVRWVCRRRERADLYKVSLTPIVWFFCVVCDVDNKPAVSSRSQPGRQSSQAWSLSPRGQPRLCIENLRSVFPRRTIQRLSAVATALLQSCRALTPSRP